MRPEISLGDLVRSLDALAPDDAATRRAVARCLGLAVGERVEPLPEPAREPELPERWQEEPSEMEGRQAAPPPRPEPSARPERELPPRPSALERIAAAQTGRRSPPLDVPPLERLLEREAGSAVPLLGDPSLFVPRWRRALLTTALSTPSPEGEIDVERLVEVAARGEAIRDIPRLPVPTLRRGVQLLLDYGKGMEPFLEDRRRMAETLEHTLGADSLHVLKFHESPLRGAGIGRRRTWAAYEIPPRGRPVLALTDLGLSGVSALGTSTVQREWRDLARRLAHSDSRLLVLTPYPRPRWPAELARHLTLLFWDRSTGVHDVRRALAGGRGG